MKVTTLLENTSKNSQYQSAHGLSLLIESCGIQILFDTGPDDAFIANAKLMNIDLTEVDYIVISHGHRDHTGGLISMLNLNVTAPVYIKDSANEMFYSKQKNLIYKDISMPNKDLENSRFKLVDDLYNVSDRISILTVKSINGFVPSSNQTLYKKQNGDYLRDDFNHEIILCVKEDDGLVVFTGCSHTGIGNMLETVKNYYPNQTIKAVFGGMHLYNRALEKSEDTINVVALSKTLLTYEHCHYFTGHCTGKVAFDVLKKTLGDRIHHFRSGTKHDI